MTCFAIRLMALLSSIDPSVPLPIELEPYLFKHMEEECILKHGRVLEERFEKHKKTYYVVTGFVIVYAFDERDNKHTLRIYCKNTIVALDSFMNETESECVVWACAGAILYSITRKHKQAIYDQILGIELMAQKKRRPNFIRLRSG